MSRLTRDATAEPVSRDQIIRRERGQGNINMYQSILSPHVTRCGTLVSTNAAVHRQFYGTYHDQREQILAKMGPERSLVHFLRRFKLGGSGRTFDCWITGGISRHRIISEQSREVLFNYRYDVHRRPTTWEREAHINWSMVTCQGSTRLVLP